MIDAARIDAWVPVDATPPDAPVTDAAPIDAPSPDAPVVDAVPADAFGSNPLQIAFTEVTDALPQSYLGGSIDPNPWGLGSGASIGDLDGDGNLDLVLARCDIAGTYPAGPSALLFRTGTTPLAYTEDTAFAAQTAGICAHGAALGDFDGDGDLDIFLAASGPDRLFRNEGAGVFTDVTSAAGVAGPIDDVSPGAVWADVNADGLLDLYVLRSLPTSSSTPIRSTPIACT